MPGLVPRLAAMLAEWPVGSRESNETARALLLATEMADGRQ